MDRVFFNHAKDQNQDQEQNIREQITELDNIVVAEVVPSIVSELEAYTRYLKDVFGPRQIMDRPINTSNAGKKALPSVTSRFEW